MKKWVQSLASIAFWAGALLVSRYIKISYIVGARSAFFSGAAVAAPLTGLFVPAGGSLLLTGVRILFANPVNGLSRLAFYVPGFIGSLYWNSPNSIIRLFTPALCFILFIAHPVGQQAWPYALYWLIPIALYFIQTDNLFLHALASTFIVHAVGSCIWIYTMGMSPEQWTGLIPIVACERAVYAASTVLVYKCIKVCLSTLKKKVACIKYVPTCLTQR